MENVYDLHQHDHCFVMYITKEEIVTYIHNTSKRCPVTINPDAVSLDASISYNKRRTDVTGFAWDCKKIDRRSNIVIDNFQDGLYKLFKKNKETWNKEDRFFMKAVSDYLPLAVKEIAKKMKLQIENFDSVHYAFIVPSEWEEEMRKDILRPIFVQSGLISNEDHQDRLLFYTDIEAICYSHSFKRGDNTILCRIIEYEKETIIKFDLIQTATTLFNIPNAKLFPKVMKSSSVSISKDGIARRIKEFLRENLFPVVTTDYDSPRKSLKRKLALLKQDKIIDPILKDILRERFLSLEEEEKAREKPSWISFNEDWMLSESQKEFINSLWPSIICAGIGTFLLDYMTDIISNNFTKSYSFLAVRESSDRLTTAGNNVAWVDYILKHNSRSLNFVDSSEVKVISAYFILRGAAEAVFEAIQHSDIYCKPRIVPSADLSTSSSVFLNSKPDAIINLDISLRSTLFTCSLLDEGGLTRHIFDHDLFIGDRRLPPLGYFYTFSNRTTLDVREQFIPFAERYLLGDLSDLISDDGVSIKKNLLLEMNSILAKDRSGSEVLVSITQKKYIEAFILMYMIYIKEEILYKFLDKFIPHQIDMKIGYAVCIESLLLNNTMESKDNFRDIIYESELVPKDDDSKKLRITTQGERILPAIQKSLKLELSLKSYFLLCQLHEDYVQLSLHQVVTASSPEEKGQESIIVQDEIIPIQNIYDTLCSSMWCNLLQDNSLIELCEMHNTSDNNKTLNLFSPKVKTAFFDNLKDHISYNVLQSNPNTQSTYTISLTSSCNCKVRLTTSDIIDISFMPALQDIACTLSASLLNKELFGNYINIDYLFSFIRFNHNPQLQRTFETILEEEANDFNLEMGIDTSCLVVPELFGHLLKPFIAQRPFCYKDFKIGALQHVCSENYVFSLNVGANDDTPFIYKSKITDTKTIECRYDIAFPFLNKGEVINNVQSNRKFYLRNMNYDNQFFKFEIDVYRFETMKYLENNETLSCDDNSYQHVGHSRIFCSDYYALKDVDIPVMVSVKYVSYTSSFQFFVKLIGPDAARDKYVTGVAEAGIPLTLTRL